MKKGVRYIAAVLAITMGFLAGSCQVSHQVEAVDVEPNGWQHPATLRLSNADTTAFRDLEFFVRCDKRLAGDTLTLRIAVQTPDTLHYQEPFQLFIPSNTAPAALVREVVIPYRYRVRFPRIGTYHMTLTPTRTVCGIEAIGINTIKSK